MAKIGIQNILRTSDQAIAAFGRAVSTSEQKMFDEVLLLIKELDTTPSGTIKTSIANLKRVQQIRSKLSKLANNKDYLSAVRELVRSFDTLYREQLSYYAVKNQSSVAKQKHKLVKTIARENTIAALTGDGLTANVTAQLDKMLLLAVTTGAKFSDLQKDLARYLVTDDGSQGALSRYANTYAVTALSQYAGQHNKLFTDDLDTDWFEYVGSTIETSRPFCLACTKKRYIHRSEIHDLLAGHIHIVGSEDIDVKLYDKTGLPYGMIEGTTEENFQVNVGGWNCRHQLVPVAKEAVPETIQKVQQVHQQADALRKTGDYQDIQTNDAGGLKAIHKGHTIHSADKEQTFFDDHLTSTDLELACQDQLYRMGHTAILRDESRLNQDGNQLSSLDLELDGIIMDIASITNWNFGNALYNKDKQLWRVQESTGYSGDAVCIYVYDPAMYSNEKVLHDIEFFKHRHENSTRPMLLKKIHIIIRGDNNIHTFKI